MDESAAELVNGLRPTMKRLCEFDHLTVGDARTLSLRCPFRTVYRSIDELLTVGFVSDGQEVDDTDHRIQFLAKDRDNLRQKGTAVDQVDRFPMLRRTSANLSAKRV